MGLRYRSIIAYADIIKREDVMLQRGMNFRIKPSYSIILMSVRKGAPYNDRWHQDTGLLEYEGHDELRRGNIEPKAIDQPMVYSSGKLTENGKFYNAAVAYKGKNADAEIVQVYEKIAEGVWCDRGRYELIDAKIVSDKDRKVFRFFLKPTKTPYAKEPVLSEARLIPTAVKVEVWKRDRGKCVMCGSSRNLHFDHDIPFSKGGSSITAENVRLLCAKHNLAKSDRIMSFVPWFISASSLMATKSAV